MFDSLLPVFICFIALVLDRIFGEPKYHPLIWFGTAASWLESRLNNRKSRYNGAMAVFVVVGIPVAVVLFLHFFIENIWLGSLLDIGVLYFVVGWQSMKQHALAISNPLLNNDLEGARFHLSMIVSRETSEMDEPQIVGSTIESILENGHDCVFASLFWFLLLGPAGTLLHRLMNTLDAMWGYKNERYRQFGYVAARLDDLLGFLPARLTGLSYALSGSCKNALVAWYKQIGQHKSPNAGLVMASGAGALEITIGGPAIYDGIEQHKPYLGVGTKAQVRDIQRSITLVEKALIVWLMVSAIYLFF